MLVIFQNNSLIFLMIVVHTKKPMQTHKHNLVEQMIFYDFLHSKLCADSHALQTSFINVPLCLLP